MTPAEPAMPPGNPLTVVREAVHEIGGAEVLIGIRSALSRLGANQERINDLNVFPVPDGDTGSNMYLTLSSAVDEALRVKDPTSSSVVMAAVAHGSLMGARGNSGVILSQILRGFATGVGGRQRIDGETLASALVEAASVAYRAVMKPTEGTVLTVVREASQAARAASRETADIRQILDRAVAEAHAAVARTTDQLAVLREAGVVDAGGEGFAVILEGFARAVTDPDAGAAEMSGVRRVGEPPVAAVPRGKDQPAIASPRRGAAAVEEAETGWGYCTEFLVHGPPAIDVDALREVLSGLGDSTLVVGDEELARVHIHTHDPTGLIAVAAEYGRLSKLKVEDMTAQHHEILERAERTERTPQPIAAPRQPLAVVPVASGPGFHEIFAGLGAVRSVDGGQTMNPSIENLLDAVRAANAESVILLPNNRNVILTAEQIDAIVDDVDVVVIPTRNAPQGISAMLAFDPTAPIADNATAMRAAVARVRCVEITRAVRDSTSNGREIHAGDVIAVVDDEIAEVGSDYQTVIEAVLRGLATPPDLITMYRGAHVDEAEAEDLIDQLRDRFPGSEIELHTGGQEHYPYVLSLE